MEMNAADQRSVFVLRARSGAGYTFIGYAQPYGHCMDDTIDFWERSARCRAWREMSDIICRDGVAYKTDGSFATDSEQLFHIY